MEKKTIIFFILFYQSFFIDLISKAPLFNNSVYLKKELKNDFKIIIPENPLKTSWRESKKRYEKANLLLDHVKHMYCLACHQNQRDKPNVELIINELKKENQKHNFADGLLIKHFIKKGALLEIPALPIFKQGFLAEDLYNLDKESGVLLTQALCALKEKDSAEKVIVFLEKNFSEDEQIIYQILLHKLEVGDKKSVLEKLNHFLSRTSLRSKHIPFFLLKAFLLTESGDLKEALKTINLALELQPFHEKLLQQKISVLSSLNMGEELLLTFQKLSEVSGNPEIRKHLINVYLQENKLEAALTELVLLKEDSIQVFLNKITLQSKLNQHCEALETFNRFLDSNLAKSSNQNLKKLEYSLLFQAGKHETLLNKLFIDFRKHNFNESIFFNMLKIAKKSDSKSFFINNSKLIFRNKEKFLFMKIALANFCEDEHFIIDALDIYDNILSQNIVENHEIKSQLLTSKAKMLFYIGENKESEILLHQIIETYPNLISAKALLAELENKLNKEQKQNVLSDLFNWPLHKNLTQQKKF